MRQGVTKQEFIESFEQTLKLTRIGVESLVLKDDDTLTVTYRGGYSKDINIALNSARAIIEDVMRRL